MGAVAERERLVRFIYRLNMLVSHGVLTCWVHGDRSRGIVRNWQVLVTNNGSESLVTNEIFAKRSLWIRLQGCDQMALLWWMHQDKLIFVIHARAPRVASLPGSRYRLRLRRRVMYER